MKERLQYMIEHSDNELLIANLVDVYHSLEDVLERHSELKEKYLKR